MPHPSSHSHGALAPRTVPTETPFQPSLKLEPPGHSPALTPSTAARCPQQLWAWETMVLCGKEPHGQMRWGTLPLRRVPHTGLPEALASPAGKLAWGPCPHTLVPGSAVRRKGCPTGPGQGPCPSSAVSACLSNSCPSVSRAPCLSCQVSPRVSLTPPHPGLCTISASSSFIGAKA